MWLLLCSLLGTEVWAQDLAITGATVMPVTDVPISSGVVLVKDGKIAAVGTEIEIPEGTPIIDGRDLYLLPGFIDVHSHMGVYSWPGGNAHGDGNEATEPLTPSVWAGDSFRVADPALSLARAGGVTTIQVLPGSANLVGGQSLVVKLRHGRTLDAMLFEEAPRGIKMACGENPKRVHSDEERGPSTRMGNVAALRAGFQAALDYRIARETHREPPPLDADLEVMLDVLDGDIRVNIHCYRHDDIEAIFRVMDDFGVQVVAFHHALEAYKVRDLIAAHGTAIATWPDWWGFKLEAYDGIPQNAQLVKATGVPVAIHSDSADTVQRLYTEAAKLVGTGMEEADALETITIDPARILGVDHLVGSIDAGKDADLVLMSGHPLDVTSVVQKTWIDGRLVFDRSKEGTPDARP
jgi:imidazolonepropionase-like amidohydrolase